MSLITNEQIANMTPEEVVAASQTRFSDEFGELVLEVDNRRMGSIVRRRRKLKRVHATAVATLMGLSKAQIHFLEIGRKRWDINLLQNYIDSVDSLYKVKEK